MASAPITNKPALLRVLASLSRIPAPVMLLVLALFPVVGFIAAIALPNTTPRQLKKSELQDAQTKWRAAALSNYDLEIKFIAYNNTDRPTFHYEVECRNGRVTRLLRDGNEVTSQEERDHWSVDSLLSDIGEDIEKAIAGAFNTTEGVKVLLSATFDETYAYPTKYRRLAPGNPENFEYTVKLTPR